MGYLSYLGALVSLAAYRHADKQELSPMPGVSMCFGANLALFWISALFLLTALVHADGVQRTARVSSYCARCGGSVGMRDHKLRPGDCAADPRYHRYGSRVWVQGFGTLTVRDSGRKVRGRDRFDVFRVWPGRCRCGDGEGVVRRAWREVGK